MFGGRFSHTRFSLRGEAGLDVGINVNFTETVSSLISAGQDSPTEANFRCLVSSSAILTQGISFKNTYNEKISAVIAGVRDYPVISNYKEQILFDLETNNIIDFEFNLNISEQINFVPFEGSVDTALENQFEETILSDIQFTVGVGMPMELLEKINHDLDAVINVKFIFDANEIIDSESFLSNDVLIDNKYQNNIVSNVFVGKNVIFGQDFRGQINSSIISGRNAPFELNVSESIFMASSATMIEKDSMVISVTIPPNGELRINSEDFTVTLNGKNIIHLHDGDFVNISRDTLSIQISSSGNLSGELVYIERYL